MNRSKAINTVFLWIFLSIISTLQALSVYAENAGVVPYESKGKRDPFIATIETEKAVVDIQGLYGVQSVQDIQVQGFVIDRSTGSYVIANGVVLMEGETQGDVQVIKIDERGIDFVIKGKAQRKQLLVETQ